MVLHILSGSLGFKCYVDNQFPNMLNMLDASIFSFTRRSRSDESHSLTHSLIVSTELTDVTLVREGVPVQAP